jgi:hypothetical protein
MQVEVRSGRNDSVLVTALGFNPLLVQSTREGPPNEGPSVSGSTSAQSSEFSDIGNNVECKSSEQLREAMPKSVQKDVKRPTKAAVSTGSCVSLRRGRQSELYHGDTVSFLPGQMVYRIEWVGAGSSAAMPTPFTCSDTQAAKENPGRRRQLHAVLRLAAHVGKLVTVPITHVQKVKDWEYDDGSTRLFVSCLPKGTGRQELARLFSRFGEGKFRL